jgi:hypothetical protein
VQPEIRFFVCVLKSIISTTTCQCQVRGRAGEDGQLGTPRRPDDGPETGGRKEMEQHFYTMFFSYTIYIYLYLIPACQLRRLLCAACAVCDLCLVEER